MFHIQDHKNDYMLHLINNAYLLIFERTSPIITPTSQDVSDDNFKQISLSQKSNLQFPISKRQIVNLKSLAIWGRENVDSTCNYTNISRNI